MFVYVKLTCTAVKKFCVYKAQMSSDCVEAGEVGKGNKTLVSIYRDKRA